MIYIEESGIRETSDKTKFIEYAVSKVASKHYYSDLR